MRNEFEFVEQVDNFMQFVRGDDGVTMVVMVVAMVISVRFCNVIFLLKFNYNERDKKKKKRKNKFSKLNGRMKIKIKKLKKRSSSKIK